MCSAGARARQVGWATLVNVEHVRQCWAVLGSIVARQVGWTGQVQGSVELTQPLAVLGWAYMCWGALQHSHMGARHNHGSNGMIVVQRLLKSDVCSLYVQWRWCHCVVLHVSVGLSEY